jgi:hypothetical protein
MTPSRRFLLLLLFINVFLLTGCVNLVQEVTVRQDGSGSLRFAVGVETSVYPQFQQAVPEGFQLENLFANLILDENVTDSERTSYQLGNQTWDVIEMQVGDMAAVFAEDRNFGPLTLTIDQEVDQFSFEQTLDLEQSNISIPGVNLLDLSGAGYSVRLITPQIISTNGLQEAAGVSLWEVPLSDLLQAGESVFLQADYVLEPYQGFFIPWETFFPYVVIGFLATGFISILVVIVVNTTGKDEKPRKIQF